jgi:hypothetical protein
MSMLPTGDDIKSIFAFFSDDAVIRDRGRERGKKRCRFSLAAAAGLRPGQYRAGSVVKPDH